MKSFCFSSEWFSMIRTNGKPETRFLFNNHQQIDHAFYKKLNTNTWQKLNTCCKCVNPKPVILLKSREWSGETGRLIWTVEAFLNKQWEYKKWNTIIINLKINKSPMKATLSLIAFNKAISLKRIKRQMFSFFIICKSFSCVPLKTTNINHVSVFI